MKNTDILAIGAHPDDIELGCAGTLAKAIRSGKKIVAIDLTQGELGTRGSAALRLEEAAAAASLLGIETRENMGFRDGFFQNDEAHQKALIQKIRTYRPDVVLCNAQTDRHIDHGRASDLVHDACFLSGLEKIETIDSSGQNQLPWRPRYVFHYIQWYDITPHFIVDISGFLDTKLAAVKAYSSQFYDPNSNDANTPISSKNFIDSVGYRAQNLGRLIGREAGEGFTTRQPLGIGMVSDWL
ncbi:MAG: bacillithiol biosynthesis deacetylase BshB1 [Flavobacteriaceae bacterium]